MAVRADTWPTCRICGVELYNDGDIPRERESHEVHVCAPLDPVPPIGMSREDAAQIATVMGLEGTYASHRLHIVESMLHPGCHYVAARDPSNGKVCHMWFEPEGESDGH